MKCFPRYLGDDEDESVSKESRSLALLAKLQQKAKEKQKQSLTEQRIQPPEKHADHLEVKKHRKAEKDRSREGQRSRKRKSEAVSVSDAQNHHEPVEEKKKKKKRGMKEEQKKDQSGVCLFIHSHVDTRLKNRFIYIFFSLCIFKLLHVKQQNI